MVTSPSHQITNIEVDHIKIKEPKVTAIADALSQKSISKWFHLKKKKIFGCNSTGYLKK